MPEENPIWDGVPDPQPDVPYLVDEAKDGEFTVVCDREVANYDVPEMLYLINGVWRVTIEDQDDTENPAVLLAIEVDRRYKIEIVREAVKALLTNLYAAEHDLGRTD